MKTATEDKRESRKWWAVVDGDVRRVTGYSCAPNNPDYWWCPEAGHSMSEKYHLFHTEAEALDKAIREVNEAITEYQKSLARLEKRRKTL